MEQTQISNEEKAYNAERKRVQYVQQILENVTEEYLREREKWSEKKHNYITHIDKLNKSIESGLQYIESLSHKIQL